MEPWTDQFGFRMAWPMEPFDPAPALAQVRALASPGREVVFAGLTPAADDSGRLRWRIHVLTRRTARIDPIATDFDEVTRQVLEGGAVHIFRATNRFYTPCRLVDMGVWGEISRIASMRFLCPYTDRSMLANILCGRIRNALRVIEPALIRRLDRGSQPVFTLRVLCSWALLADRMFSHGDLPTQQSWEDLQGLRGDQAAAERLAVAARFMNHPFVTAQAIQETVAALRTIGMQFRQPAKTPQAVSLRRARQDEVEELGREWLWDATRGNLRAFAMPERAAGG